MRQKSRAKAVEDLYIGSVLYEDAAAMELLAEKIADHSHSYWISIRNQSDRKHRYLGKQVFPPALSVCQLGNDSVYNGVKLLGYRQVDADGTKPMTLPIIEKGILKHMLTGRIPSLGCPASTGNEHFDGLSRTLETRYTAMSRPTAPSLIANFTNVFLKRPKKRAWNTPIS